MRSKIIPIEKKDAAVDTTTSLMDIGFYKLRYQFLIVDRAADGTFSKKEISSSSL